MKKDTYAFVMYAPIPVKLPDGALYPPSRQLEILSTKNEIVKREKYFVWELLKKACEDVLSLNFANINFTKTENGKWICPDFHFSLSHSDGAVCVAISGRPIGVDIEKIRPIKQALASKLLTARELDGMAKMPENERGRFLLESWVKKESIFKKDGGVALMPNRTEVSDHNTVLKSLRIGEDEYIISVAPSADGCDIEFIFTEEI